MARDQMRGLLVEALDPVYVELYEPRGDRAYVRLQGRLVSDGGAMPNVGFRYGPSGIEVYKTRWLGPIGAGATFEYSLIWTSQNQEVNLNLAGLKTMAY